MANASPSQDYDPFFFVPVDADADEWNACIGPQGAEENYIDGYMEAAIELASAVLDKNLLMKRDTLVLPTLYNARHAVELALKYILRLLHEVDVLPAPPEKHHDITVHWETLKAAAACDEALRKDTAALGRFVTSLARIDDDGQELRYHENQKGERSLKSEPLANFVVIRRSLDELSNLLSRLQSRVRDYQEERGTGCYTPECSLSDLIQIAKMLPPAAEWNTQAFDDAKAQIRERYNLDSNKKFIRAVDVVKRSRATRAISGLETPLHHLRDDHAIFAVQQWHKLHPPRERAENWADIGAKQMIAYGRLRHAVITAVAETLSPEEIADLETVFYLVRDRYLSDNYDKLLAATMAEYQQCNADELYKRVGHLITKPNFLDCLSRGLRRLGRPSLADQIEAIQPH